MRSFGVPLVCALVALFCLQSAEAYEIAYCLASRQNASPSYTPNPDFSYNAGKPITIFKTGNGAYRVEFGRVANTGSHVQVTMQGTSLGYCNVASWGGGSVRVLCYNRFGLPASRKFSIVAISGCGPDDEFLSYAWLNNESADNYFTNPSWRFGDGTYAVQRTSMGRYSVNMGSPTGVGATVLVTAYGSKKTCQVRGWGSTSVNLSCLNAGISFADSRSNVMVIKAGFPHASFAWNSSPGGNLAENYSYSSNGSAQSVVRTAKGRYTITLGPEANKFGNVQVTSFSSDAYCWVANWSNGKAFVRCTRVALFHDSRFTILAIS